MLRRGFLVTCWLFESIWTIRQGKMDHYGCFPGLTRWVSWMTALFMNLRRERLLLIAWSQRVESWLCDPYLSTHRQNRNLSSNAAFCTSNMLSRRKSRETVLNLRSRRILLVQARNAR